MTYSAGDSEPEFIYTEKLTGTVVYATLAYYLTQSSILCGLQATWWFYSSSNNSNMFHSFLSTADTVPQEYLCANRHHPAYI